MLHEVLKDPMLAHRDSLTEIRGIADVLQRLHDLREMELRNPEPEIDLTGASAEFLSELIQRCEKSTVASSILLAALRAFEKHPDRATFNRKNFFPSNSESES